MGHNILTMTGVQASLNMSWEPIRALAPGAQQYFDELVLNRAAVDWMASDMIALTKVAEWLHWSDVEQALLDQEGSVLVSPNGVPMRNPRFSVIESLDARAMRAMEKLAIFQTSSNSTTGKLLNGGRARTVADLKTAAAGKPGLENGELFG